MKTYIIVDYKDNDHAKSLGAKFDYNNKLWYTLDINKKKILQHYNEYKEIDNFVGEDRTFGGSELFVDLIPGKSWFKNIRSNVYGGDWDVIRRYIYKRVNNKCECCQLDCNEINGIKPSYEDEDIISLEDFLHINGFDNYDNFDERINIVFFDNEFETFKKQKEDLKSWNKPILEAHERWSFNEDTKTQKLERIIALCHRCHMTTHYGLAGLKGLHKFADKHLMKVNKWTEEQVSNHINQRFAIHKERNKIEWELNMKVITDSGIRLKK